MQVAMENNLAETAFVELLSIESESNEEPKRNVFGGRAYAQTYTC